MDHSAGGRSRGPQSLPLGSGRNAGAVMGHGSSAELATCDQIEAAWRNRPRPFSDRIEFNERFVGGTFELQGLRSEHNDIAV